METIQNDLDYMTSLFSGGLATDGLSSTREFKIYTGAEGNKLLHQAIMRSNAKDLLDWLFTKKYVDENQKVSLNSMLDSPDWENASLAIEIIKIKQDGIKV